MHRQNKNREGWRSQFTEFVVTLPKGGTAT
jgi:hypothetical protein